jgi:hypothetical protein
MSYKVLTSTGSTVAITDTYAEASDAAVTHWGPDTVVGGYNGALDDGGDQSLIWASADVAANDSGYASCGRVVLW